MKNEKKQNTNKSKIRKILVIALVALVVAAVAGAGIYYYQSNYGAGKLYPITDANGQTTNVSLAQMKSVLEVDTVYPGIYINGISVAGKTKDQLAKDLAKDPALAPSKVDIKLTCDGKEYPLNQSDLGISSNLPAIIDEAFQVARTSDKADEAEALVDRYEKYLTLESNPVKLETKYTADATLVSKSIHKLLDGQDKEAKDAEVSSFDVEKLAFDITDSVEGYHVDVDGTIKDVQKMIDAGTFVGKVTVKTNVVEPKVSKDSLMSTLSLVSSTTTDTKDNSNRNTNVRLIAEAINGLVLKPGESFDFNDYIGQRTADKGYKEAGGIFDGMIRQELGGGICQTNTTLFHSVVKADLQVDVRQPHSWPSEYVATGTDATVSWGGPDFKFTNNSEYPIAIHAYYSNLRITVEIYGRPIEDGMEIKFIGEVTGTSGPGEPEYVADPNAPAGSRTSVRDPHNYISAVSYKVFYKDGVEVKREKAFTSIYGAIRAKIMVGIRNADGTLCPMDPATGNVTLPTPPPETTAAPTEPTETTKKPTEPTETTKKPKPTETKPTETTPTTTTPTTTAPTTTAPTPVPPTEAVTPAP